MTVAMDRSQVFQHLKIIFPEISDNVIWRVMRENHDVNGCKVVLQIESDKAMYAGASYTSYQNLAMMSPLTSGMRNTQHVTNMNGSVEPEHPKHRHSEPSVYYQRTISETQLEQQPEPNSAPPCRTTFNQNYPPAYTPHYGHRNSPIRSFSTSANFHLQPVDQYSGIPWLTTQPQQFMPFNEGQHNMSVYTGNAKPTVMPSTGTGTITPSLYNVQTQSPPVGSLHHSVTSPSLSRQIYPSRQPDNLITAPNDDILRTPSPIKPMISPASSHSSLTESPEIKHDKVPLVPLIRPTKEQDDYAYTQALILHQRRRCQMLRKEYDEEKGSLEVLKNEVELMERQLEENTETSSAKAITKVAEQNRQLAIDIECMNREIELHKNQGQFDDNFYRNIGYTGAPGPVQPGHPDPRAILPEYGVPSVCDVENGFLMVLEPNEGQQWSCIACTFLNHPALNNCETCNYPRE